MVQTVFGAINDSDLGSVLSHEHVACFNPSMRMGFGEFWFNKEDVIEKAAAMFRQAKDECGITTVVDATPLDLGRDIKILREVSIRSGIQIIASSGMYYNEEVFLIGKSPARFARFFINECENGIDGTTAKPGILKCATGNQGFTDTNVMLLSTMSIVQKETQLPLYAHNTHSNKTAYRQLELFEKNGVDLHKVIIGHCSDSSDIPYLEDILRCGCFLGFTYPLIRDRRRQLLN